MKPSARRTSGTPETRTEAPKHPTRRMPPKTNPRPAEALTDVAPGDELAAFVEVLGLPPEATVDDVVAAIVALQEQEMRASRRRLSRTLGITEEAIEKCVKRGADPAKFAAKRRGARTR